MNYTINVEILLDISADELYTLPPSLQEGANMTNRLLAGMVDRI